MLNWSYQLSYIGTTNWGSVKPNEDSSLVGWVQAQPLELVGWLKTEPNGIALRRTSREGSDADPIESPFGGPLHTVACKRAVDSETTPLRMDGRAA